MFKGKEALYKINALFNKFGFDVCYYDTFSPDKKVAFYDALGDTAKQPITKSEMDNRLKEVNELKARLAKLESFLKVEYVSEKQASFYRKI